MERDQQPSWPNCRPTAARSKDRGVQSWTSGRVGQTFVLPQRDPGIAESNAARAGGSARAHRAPMRPERRGVRSDTSSRVGRTFVLPQCETRVVGSRAGRVAESAKLSPHRNATRGSQSPTQLEGATRPDFTVPPCQGLWISDIEICLGLSFWMCIHIRHNSSLDMFLNRRIDPPNCAPDSHHTPPLGSSTRSETDIPTPPGRKGWPTRLRSCSPL